MTGLGPWVQGPGRVSREAGAGGEGRCQDRGGMSRLGDRKGLGGQEGAGVGGPWWAASLPSLQEGGARWGLQGGGVPPVPGRGRWPCELWAGGQRRPGRRWPECRRTSGPAPPPARPRPALGGVENGITQEQMCTKGVKWRASRRARLAPDYLCRVPAPSAGPACARPGASVKLN